MPDSKLPLKSPEGAELLEAFLVERGALDSERARVVRERCQERGQRFVEAALELGTLTRESMAKAFGQGFRGPLFQLHAEYFPEATRKLLSAEEILSLGAVPLDYRTESRFFRARRVLNVGYLDPADKSARKAIDQRLLGLVAAQKVDRIRPFLVLGDQLLNILKQVYGLNEAAIVAKGAASGEGVHPVLRMFLNPYGARS